MKATSPFDTSSFRCLTAGCTAEETFLGRKHLVVEPEALSLLAEEAFRDVSFYFRTAHLEKMAEILKDPEASANEKYVVSALLKNAVISAEGLFPSCQDTGTATVVAWKGSLVHTTHKEDSEDDKACLTRGIFEAYRKNFFRYSQVVPLSMFDETDSGTNLPPQIDIYAEGEREYRFLFVAKGAGSANKTSFFQESRALLEPEKLERFLREKTAALGTAACPPYHLAVVIGGTSPEHNLKTLKLATAGLLDGLPSSGDKDGRAFVDGEWSAKLLDAARETGLGAQFGGKYLALDARVVRLPRHAGSCPVSIGVSCCADRNILGKITAEGVFLEELDREPSRFLASAALPAAVRAPRIDLRGGMPRILEQLRRHAPGTLVLLSGPLVVARDIAHAKLHERLSRGETLPRYFLDHPVYYAGPAKTPPGHAIGSFGPTTAQRMDAYLPDFMKAGACLVTLAKGNRSPAAAAACREHEGFYLGTVGGAAALLAEEGITSSEIVDFPELGMEAVRLLEVKDFPAFVLTNDKGEDFYHTLAGAS